MDAVPYIEERIKHLEEQAHKLGIGLKFDRKGQLIGFGKAMPNITELIDGQLQEGGTYRLLSAVAHGRTWAELALGLRLNRLKGRRVVKQELSVDAAMFLIVSSLDWFTRAVWAYFKLNGWDLERLKATLEAKYDKASLRPEARFWRMDARGKP